MARKRRVNAIMVSRVPWARLVLPLIVAALAFPVNGSDTLAWNGFALVRGADPAESGVFHDNRLSSQVQLGLDWTPFLTLGAHLHLVARSDPEGSRRGAVGLTQAYLELNLPVREDRLRILGGAFFLPTSRENVDALWENPYTITSSALNSWLGEEFRPVGIDASYTFRRSVTFGATVFRGNDTLGALPAARGWVLRDHLGLLGERLFLFEEPDGEEHFSSVSAESDDRLGWSARTRWKNEFASVQLTHIDNRSDGLQHGELENWDTQFDILGAEYSRSDWTIAAEYGWGVTTIVVPPRSFAIDLSATYLLISRRFAQARVSLRQDWFEVDEEDGQALTATLFWLPRGPWRFGIEVATSDDDDRILLEGRYHFSDK